jgi:hypothetical protein
LTLDFPTSRTRRNKFVIHKPPTVYGIGFCYSSPSGLRCHEASHLLNQNNLFFLALPQHIADIFFIAINFPILSDLPNLILSLTDGSTIY